MDLFAFCLLIVIAYTTSESADGCTDGCTSASLTSYKPADRADASTASSTAEGLIIDYLKPEKYGRKLASLF
jgi:hypothetical protein